MKATLDAFLPSESDIIHRSVIIFCSVISRKIIFFCSFSLSLFSFFFFNHIMHVKRMGGVFLESFGE